MGSMKHAETLVAKNIAKYTGLRSGTRVKFCTLVWVAAIGVTSKIQLYMSWLWARNRKKKTLKSLKSFIAASKPI